MGVNNQTKNTRDEIYQKITDICFENGGATKPMVDKLYALITQTKQETIAEIIEDVKQVLEDIKNDRNPDERTLEHFKDAQDGKRSMSALLSVLIANEYYFKGEEQAIKEVIAVLDTAHKALNKLKEQK